MSGEHSVETTIDHVIGETAALRALIAALVETHPNHAALDAALSGAMDEERQRITHENRASHPRQRALLVFEETLDALRP